MKGKTKLLITSVSLVLLLVTLFFTVTCVPSAAPAPAPPPPAATPSPKPAPTVATGLIPKQTALLVIDPHNEVLHKEGKFAALGVWKYAEEHNTIANIAKAIKLCEEQGIPVIRVSLHFHHGYPSVPDRGFMQIVKAKEGFLEGTWGAEYVSGLEVKPGQIEICKKRFSAFYDTELDTLLRGLGTTTLLICGVSATHCVNGTVVDAVDRDYNIIALTDAIAGPSEELVECAYKLWALWGVKLMTVEEALSAK